MATIYTQRQQDKVLQVFPVYGGQHTVTRLQPGTGTHPEQPPPIDTGLYKAAAVTSGGHLQPPDGTQD